MNAAIVGVGATEFSSRSGRTEQQLAVEAIRAALDDAGIEPGAVDGVVRFSYDSNTAASLIRSVGFGELSFVAEVPHGGFAACGIVAQAAAAVDAGLASCVVCFRALNGRSGTRYGRGERFLSPEDGSLVARGEQIPGGAFAAPFGLLAPGQVMAMWAKRYQALYRVSDDLLTQALGTVAVTQRTYAQANPGAVTYGQPLTLDEHRESRMISSPLRLFDLCRESDGGVAVVVARSGRGAGPEARVLAAKQHLFAYSEPLPVYVDDITILVRETAVRDLYREAGVDASDIDVLAAYDATSLNVLLSVEDYGFCGRGEGVAFILEGETGPAGRLPTNTHGGLLSEGYLHGLNVVADAVQQIRGRSFNQVPGAELALVTSRGGSLVLGS